MEQRPACGARAGWHPLGALGSLLAVIGVHSYSIYLWHMPVVRWVLLALDRSQALMGMSPTAAFVLRYRGVFHGGGRRRNPASRMVERPMLALRDRRYPSRAG